MIAGFSSLSAAAGQDPPGRPFLEQIDFEDPVSQVRLAPSLREISGLATAGNRLFAHNDEDGLVVELDPVEGDVLKWIRLGPDRVRGDFEGVAFAGDSLFLVTSGGTLVAFQEGADGESVPFEATITGLAERCEIEGLAESRTGSLFAVCKTNRDRGLRNGLQIFALAKPDRTAPPEPMVRFERTALQSIGLDRLRPSGIVELEDGHLLILDAQDRLILELDASYRPVGWIKLDRDHHRQPEGIAISVEGDLLIADEGGRGRARLTRYGRTGRSPPTK